MTFIDDNGNYVTLNTAKDEENQPETGVAMARENVFYDISDIVLKRSYSNESDGSTGANMNDFKPHALSVANDNADLTENVTAKAIHAVKPISNEEILNWLDRCHPTLADTFTSDFNISLNRPPHMGLPRTGGDRADIPDKLTIISTGGNSNIDKSTLPTFPVTPPESGSDVAGSGIDNNPQLPAMTASYHLVVNNILRHYHTLTEEGQKDLWLGALASNDADLIQELTLLRMSTAITNSNGQLAKLTKDFLTHSEKHKLNELKYEENAGKRRLYFHNWLTRLAQVIKMFSQTAAVFDTNNNVVPFSDPACIGNRALYL